MQKRHIKAAIFDLDGTLVDSKKDIIDSVNYMLRRIGLKEKPAEVIQGYIGRGKDWLISGALGAGAAPENLEEAGRIFGKYYFEHMFDSTRLFPGVLEILEYLKNKALMIATNKKRDLTALTLKRFHIDKYFGKIVGGDDTNCRKPDACPIDVLIADTRVSKNETIMIGDSDIDVESGKRAGVITCGLTCGIGDAEAVKNAKPDYLLDDIRKLKEIVY